MEKKQKIGSHEFKNFVMHAAVISKCHREGSHISALLLGVIAMFSFGCQHRDEATTSRAGQIKANQDCLYELSPSFRDVAEDAFDKLQSLESNELQGKLSISPPIRRLVEQCSKLSVSRLAQMK